MAKDISNQKLFGLISAETIASAAALVIVGAMALQALASEQDSQKADLTEIKSQQKKFIENFQSVNVSLERISSDQRNGQKDIKRIEDNVKYIREILDKAYAK